MSKAKLIYNQTLMISTGILLGMGIRTVVLYFTNGQEMIQWELFIPISIIITGFLCSLPSLILYWADENTKVSIHLAEVLHCISVLLVVSLCGYLFKWYTDLREYLFILLLYVLIYGAVWVYTIWMFRADEKKINQAIGEIRDEE